MTLLAGLEIVITAVCALAAVWVLVLLARDRTAQRWFLTALLGVEALVVLHLVVGLVHVSHAPRGVAVWEYVAYLVGLVLVLPAGVVWSSGEQSRGGTAVLLIALLVVPFLFLRLSDIWAGGA